MKLNEYKKVQKSESVLSCRGESNSSKVLSSFSCYCSSILKGEYSAEMSLWPSLKYRLSLIGCGGEEAYFVGIFEFF
jgi:hypothetical protein